MLALFSDYLQYRSLRGRYGNGTKSLLPDLFEEMIPDEVLALLKPGDAIWTSSKQSLRSWLIMYYCHLPLSHVTIYLGERNIGHATTSGVVVQEVDDLFNRGLRFLPCRVLLGDKKKRQLIQDGVTKDIGRPYSYRRPILAWLYIVTGRNWGTFKWKFYYDFLFIYMLSAALTPFPTNRIFVALATAHLVMALIFGLLWHFRPIPFHSRGLSLNMSFALRLSAGMLPLVNRMGSLDSIDNGEIVAAFREKD